MAVPMLRSYLTIAWRNIKKNKAYSALNVVGLAAFFIAAAVIGLQTYRAATANPARSMRYE